VTQAYYYTYPGYGETNNPTYKTFQFLKDHLGTQMVKIYPVEDPNTLKYYNYRGYVTTYPGRGTARGDIILWGLNWGDTDININFQVNNLSNLFTYTLSTKYRLAAPSLLHGDVGSLNETCAPLPTQELPITQVGVSSPTWSNGQISLSVPVSKYSWVAYMITRTPKSSFYNLRTPFLFNFSSQSQAAAATTEFTTPSLSPYPAPEAEPGGWEANPADREGIPYP
jgi:hypothetical protein